jgi:tungstate transport system substrate-binding protein
MLGSQRKTIARRSLLVLALVALAAAAIVGASLADGSGRAVGKAVPDNAKLALYSTTSVRDSGLMQELVLPAYNAAHPGITVTPIYVGSGQAIQAARDGLADVIIVHSPADEKQLLADGVATLRLPFAYNYFTIVGPKGDPANVATAKTAGIAFKRIAAYGKKLGAGKVAFVSRGDASGTNKKELQLWFDAKVTSAATVAPTGAWYLTAVGGMLPCLQVAAEKHAYTLTDSATWLANRKTLMPALYRKLDKKADLKNQYSVLLLNQAMHDQVASTGAEWLASWLVSYDGQKAIGVFGKDKYREPLFFPNAFTISSKL